MRSLRGLKTSVRSIAFAPSAPARLPQLVGSFAAIWDEILPPTPEAVWRDNLAVDARDMSAGGGVAHV